MQYRKFGKTGIDVSLLGFGAMRLPDDVDEAVRIMQRSFELGVNYLDSAYGYANSEVKCGKALKGWRDKVYVSTKNPTWEDKTTDGWWKRLHESLERLETDYIDFYQVVHGLGYETYESFLIESGGMKAVRKAQDQGLIKHVCFSTHDSVEGLHKLINTGEFEGLTLQYNLLDRTYEEVIIHAHEAGMGVVVMGPVGGGRLGAPSKEIMEMVKVPVKTSAEIALKFVFANQNVSTAISGMENIEMVEENCRIASDAHQLSADEYNQIAEALNQAKGLADLYCTGCKYCIPCPNGVDIPGNFELMNNYRIFGLKEHSQKAYDEKSKPENKWAGNKAEDCIECGLCEPKCPQNIKIIEQLKEVAAIFGKK